MKRVFQHILAVALSFLILFSTLSLSVGMHFCGDHLVEFSIGRKATSCGMETTSSPGVSGQCAMAVMQCCTDLEIVLQGQEELQFSTNTFSFSELPVVNFTPPVIPWPTFYAPPLATIFQFKEYTPPPIIRKVHLLHEAFLI